MDIDANEVSLDEQRNVRGGDWYDISWAAAEALGIAAGALAAPELIVAAGIAGAILAY